MNLAQCQKQAEAMGDMDALVEKFFSPLPKITPLKLREMKVREYPPRKEEIVNGWTYIEDYYKLFNPSINRIGEKSILS